jgi:hypothetical protein
MKKDFEAKRFGRFNLILKNQKTGAYLWHKKDSVKPDKGCLR